MGLEANCTARFGRKVSSGKAWLEAEALIFRGAFRLSISLKKINSVEAKRGRLTVKFPNGVAVFDLGPPAEKWMLKIRYPRSRIDKLGVKPATRVAVVGIQNKDFWRELKARTPDVSNGKPKKDSDFIFLAAETKEALRKLKPLQNALKPNGAIWVVYPKGRKHITQGDMMAAAKKAGLVDVKICSFSETHTALKMVIPLARR